ncbi:HET-domain-containing protein [Hypoxylon cercidicola]|nr:HET-domain-containing protein [Hypoxylon cercidicola]
MSSHEDKNHSPFIPTRDDNHAQFTALDLCQRCQPWGQINIHSIVCRSTITRPFTTFREDTSVEQLTRDPQCALCAAVFNAYSERSQALPSLQSWPPQRIVIRITGPFYTDQFLQDQIIMSRQPDVSDPNYIVVRTFLELNIRCLPREHMEENGSKQCFTEQKDQVATATDEAPYPQLELTITPQFKMKYSNEEIPVLCGIEEWETPHFDVGVLKNWLKHCSDVHGTECVAKAGENAVLPEGFRVIDTEEMSVIQPSGFIHFVALSYMWSCDPNDNVQLEKSNVDALQAPGSLRKTTIPGIIADAITLCRDLGERYLWVDRLCIIQDDEITKPCQINAMDKIYSLATLTIIGALNVRNGLGLPGVGGRPRHPRASIWSRPHSADVEGQGTRLDNLISDVIDTSLWNKRGWTFQERLLSKRRLFITESQVIFECCQGQATELLTWTLATVCESPATVDIPAKIGDSEEATSFTSINERSKSQRAMAVPGFYEYYRDTDDSFVFKETASIQDYCRWVKDYSSRQLSCGTDILNAFAGIGNSLSAAWDSEVLYGIPEKYFPAGLLWDSMGTASRGGNIPSWSWASSLTPIDYEWHCKSYSREFFQIASLVYFYYQDPSQGLRKLDTEERWIQHQKTIEELAKGEELPPLEGKKIPGEWRTNWDWRQCPQSPWETFKCLALDPDACNIAAMFPGSLVFNTTVASLEIDHLHKIDYVKGPPMVHEASNALLRNRWGDGVGVLSNMDFRWIEERRSNEGNKKLFDIIILSGQLEKYGVRKYLALFDKWEDMWLLDVMLVERLPCKPFVARRVAVGTVKMCKWKDCEPRWETVVLC